MMSDLQEMENYLVFFPKFFQRIFVKKMNETKEIVIICTSDSYFKASSLHAVFLLAMFE